MLYRKISFLAAILPTIGLTAPAHGQIASSANCSWHGNDGAIVSQSCTLQRINQRFGNVVYPHYVIKWQDGVKTDISWNPALKKYSTPEGKAAELDGLFIADGLRYPRKIHLVGLGSVFINDQCDLNHAIYEDVDGKGLRLEFSPPKRSSGVPQTQAVIRHKTRGIIFRLELSQSNGYGSIGAGGKSSKGTDTSRHRVNFFDADLKSTSGLLGRMGATPYMFITELGSSDYYNNFVRGDSIGDPLWKFAQCKK